MPASETSAIAAPSASRRSSSGPRLRGVVVVVGRERRRDAVVVEQLAGHARVLAGDQVGGGQHLERPQRDVAQIADRGGDEVQPRSEPRHDGLVPVEDIVPPAQLFPAWAVYGGVSLHRGKSSAALPRPSWAACFGPARKSLSFPFG